METCSVVLTFESVDEILWRDHSNETSEQYFCMVPFVF